MTAAVHSAAGSQSLRDAILSDTWSFVDVAVDMPPRRTIGLLISSYELGKAAL
ncbi:MAG: hypothetical protein J2P28_15590 [Actinobacteria bacterium]|nr:hypothetical protein [Actinomycetota bacterium]